MSIWKPIPVILYQCYFNNKANNCLLLFIALIGQQYEPLCQTSNIEIWMTEANWILGPVLEQAQTCYQGWWDPITV
jgi:hypothetical protein